jgi:hypothetical protein
VVEKEKINIEPQKFIQPPNSTLKIVMPENPIEVIFQDDYYSFTSTLTEDLSTLI